MATDDITVLCTGDLHLGRHPTRIPEALDGRRFSPKAAWQSTVQAAIDRAVDAVLVTGDVVDRETRFFEAFGPFERGLDRLDEAGIPVLVASGNHDFDVLPGLIDGLDLDGVHFLGGDGTWERTTVEREGETLCHVDGWSYPDEHVLRSPLEDYDRSSPGDVPLIGLLHAELDTPDSRYAPVTTAELVDTPADAWLLGHIHKPGVHRTGDPFVAYPGSPQGLDPGERGPHGPWIVTVDASGGVDAEHVPLAGLRYDRLAVDVGDAQRTTDVPAIVSDRVSDHVRDDVETGSLELLLLGVRLTGRTPVHGGLVAERSDIEEQLSFGEDSLRVRVETVAVDTRPAVDLADLASGESPAAYLAELLLTLEAGEADDGAADGGAADGGEADDGAAHGGGPDDGAAHGGEPAAVEAYPQLVADAREAMQRAYRSNAYNELRREGGPEPPDETDAVETLERQAKLLLDALLAQKEGSP